jgi:hypothetical protein
MGTLITTDEHKSAALAKLKAAGMDWIKPEPGFRFLDGDGDEMIVIGWGGWRDFVSDGAITVSMGRKTTQYPIYDMKMMPPTLVGVNLYKGEWYLRDIPNMEMLDQCRPIILDGSDGL